MSSVAPIAESSEPASLVPELEVPAAEGAARPVTRQPSTGSGVEVGEVHLCLEEEDPNDSGIESSGGNGGHPTLEREGERERRVVGERRAVGRVTSTGSDVFDAEQERGDCSIPASSTTPSTTAWRAGLRQRQISTSLVAHPVVDDNLVDFHQHRLEQGADPLAVRYNMYSMVCHR